MSTQKDNKLYQKVLNSPQQGNLWRCGVSVHEFSQRNFLHLVPASAMFSFSFIFLSSILKTNYTIFSGLREDSLFTQFVSLASLSCYALAILTVPSFTYLWCFLFYHKMCTLFQKMQFRVCFLKMFRPLKG